ncbi:MAG: AbrB/MazE/SpoVT family DNA-binding domain-containing protein [Thermoanaerobaculia bacterium]|nr:AbrB/MazE/SpoVT family DNA-binding domain-containing protein [Thermoanaerobaculia bacterium]
MKDARSKITSQGQVTVPAIIRKRLGLGPGSTIEWREVGEEIVVSRVARCTSEEIHRALFEQTPSRRATEDFDSGIRERMRSRFARD